MLLSKKRTLSRSPYREWWISGTRGENPLRCIGLEPLSDIAP